MGVLEAHPPLRGDAAPKDHLSLAFRFENGRWRPVCQGNPYSGECNFEGANAPREWEVVFNGKRLGAIQTQGWQDSSAAYFYGALAIQSPEAPSIKESAAPFVAWFGAMSRRPLVAMLQPFQGPTTKPWRRVAGHVQPKDIGIAWPVFKARFPSIPNCKFDDNGKPLGKSRPATPRDIEVFDRIELPDGGYLIGVHAKEQYRDECAEYGDFTSDVWMFKPRRGPPRELQGFETNGWPYSLVLVDIGAFAGDGTTQAVFFYAGYNEDGYVLYYDNYRKKVRFTWRYH